ncbi:MAG: ABC transporter ATP-binding protein [Phycisphaeraceae bacterium]|nr:ABC transporter ATP-binding protein [Phycisphaeraceae bacterium]MCW5762556.1 ABC transporter ATP-binding protein [Phycisphaeraceae bacterium]
MIELKNITKTYGALTAVDDLSLNIGPGEIFGFIGPNGAGKSTTMKILACLLRPDRGVAKVDGFNVMTDGEAIRRILGYMPDFLGVYEDLTVDEYLHFFASAFRIERRKRRAIVDSVLALTDLTDKKNAMVSGLSRGMQQRLGIARVLIHDPKVLLLDEPASGLDPRARIEMRSLLTELGRMGKVLMVSSHILTELAEMCSSVGIIERGKLLFSGSIQEAYRSVQAGEVVRVRLENADASAAVASSLTQDERVRKVEHKDDALDVELIQVGMGHHFVIERVIAAGGRIAAFEPREIKLEDAFLKLTKGAVQ